MKTYARFLFAAFTAAALLGGVTSCKKDEAAPGLSAKIQNIVPQAALDDMKAKGLVINEGNTPPNIEGVFEVSPFTLLAPYSSEDTYSKGRVVSNYRYRFTAQNGDEVKMEEKQVGGSNTGTGTASFLSGSGNKFTLFGQVVGTSSGIANKYLTVITGEMTATGIKDFQYATLITEKTGDVDNLRLIPVNKSRVWIDGNQLASKTNAFRLAAPDPQLIDGGSGALSR
ncbi:hypothetical protein [Spirosoma montaniterrae]|uniref:Lipoprotein n=1 Tax=Spirosoma montaniterrae TaxID=1178516 RepID=A0A1P9WU86_9BACT|nr:hypothetical protein [Spirosoma montaniterrae]AQG78890.1 hypothetical protein AWR27_05850 [Spirosoma montaniterrae]